MIVGVTKRFTSTGLLQKVAALEAERDDGAIVNQPREETRDV